MHIHVDVRGKKPSIMVYSVSYLARDSSIKLGWIAREPRDTPVSTSPSIGNYTLTPQSLAFSQGCRGDPHTSTLQTELPPQSWLLPLFKEKCRIMWHRLLAVQKKKKCFLLLLWRTQSCLGCLAPKCLVMVCGSWACILCCCHQNHFLSTPFLPTEPCR